MEWKKIEVLTNKNNLQMSIKSKIMIYLLFLILKLFFWIINQFVQSKFHNKVDNII